MIPFLKKFLTTHFLTKCFYITICCSKRSYLTFRCSCCINDKRFLRGVFALQSLPTFSCGVISTGWCAKPWWLIELNKISLDRSWHVLFFHIQHFNLLSKMWPLGLLKNGKNRHVKYMFFANIFVNIDHKEMITEYNIVCLIKIHKSNSIHFLSKWHSFWEFWCQSWHILHITLIQWTSRKVNVNIGVRIRGFFSKIL